MLETLKIAFVSTVLGMLISMPLALLSNRNQNPDWIALPVRLMLAGARTLPSIIWAILFVILIGLGLGGHPRYDGVHGRLSRQVAV